MPVCLRLWCLTSSTSAMSLHACRSLRAPHLSVYCIDAAESPYNKSEQDVAENLLNKQTSMRAAQPQLAIAILHCMPHFMWNKAVGCVKTPLPCKDSTQIMCFLSYGSGFFYSVCYKSYTSDHCLGPMPYAPQPIPNRKHRTPAILPVVIKLVCLCEPLPVI